MQSNHSKKIKNENGYTLIELIIAIQLFVIVTTLLYSVFVFSQKFTINWLNDSTLWQERLVKINYIEKELSESKEIIGIQPNRINYLNSDYINTSIFWSGDSVQVGKHIIDKLKINSYRTSYDSKSSSESLKDIKNIVLYFERDSVFIEF